MSDTAYPLVCEAYQNAALPEKDRVRTIRLPFYFSRFRVVGTTRHEIRYSAITIRCCGEIDASNVLNLTRGLPR